MKINENNCFDVFQFLIPAAWWCLLVVPVLELWGLFWWGWNWTNLGHLIGLACGVGIVLMLPVNISMKRRPAFTY